MLGQECGVPEERWVDRLLGKLSPEASEAMDRHADSCSACRFARKQWSEWLGDADQDAFSASPEAMAEGPAPMPANRIYRSLRRKMAARSAMTRLRHYRSDWTVAVACAAILAFGIVGWQAISDRQPLRASLVSPEPQDYALLHEPDGARLMNRPGTKVISMNGLAGWPGASPSATRIPVVTVWLNAEAGELFVLLEGLTASDAKDIQAWGAGRDRLTSLGLLEFHRDQGHLYSQFQAIPEFDSLRFTIEPKGGSERPTLPESAFVQLSGP